MATKQTQAIQIANTYFQLAQQLLTLSQQVQIAKKAWSDTGTANVLASLSTAALNADGSLGQADTQVNTANPIDTRQVTGLARTTSSNQISAIVSVMDSIPNFVESLADVPVQGGIRAILNNASGG